MKKAAAIVTNRGGRTCHAAIISRELGLPAVVGTLDGTEELKDGEVVTVSCAEGDTGRVYSGQLKFNKETLDFSGNERPKTRVMVNVANPVEAFRTSQVPNDGVGLACMEFIINSYIKIHPLALLNYDKLTDHSIIGQGRPDLTDRALALAIFVLLAGVILLALKSRFMNRCLFSLARQFRLHHRVAWGPGVDYRTHRGQLLAQLARRLTRQLLRSARIVGNNIHTEEFQPW